MDELKTNSLSFNFIFYFIFFGAEDGSEKVVEGFCHKDTAIFLFDCRWDSVCAWLS